MAFMIILMTLNQSFVQTKLSTAKEMAYLSKKLVTIDCFAPVDVTIDQFEFKPDWQKVQQTFADYEFKRLIDRIRILLKCHQLRWMRISHHPS